MPQSLFHKKHIIITGLCVTGTIFFISYGVLKKTSHQRSVVKDPEEYQIKLQLPINVLKINDPTKSRVSLQVAIPKDFRSVYPLTTIMKANLSEFIPKRDRGVDSWTEIITTNQYIGNSLKALQVTDCIQRGISQGDASVRVLESDNKEYQNFSESMFLMTYVDKGRREIVYGKYYSGPYDCSGFQYAIALDHNMTEERAKHKIREFVKNNTDIIKF